MNKLSKASIAVASLLATTLVSAASLDFREEYKHGGEERAGRIKISAGVGNHYFGVEAKHSGELDELERADNEFEYGYNWNIDKQWRIQTAMPVTFGSNGRTTYKPQVRVQYKFENGITTKFRYRHELRNVADGENLNRSKVTGNIDYNWNAWQFGFEANYAEDFFAEKWNNGEHEWDYNFKIGYKEKDWSWRPYIELGNVQCNSACEKAGEDSSRQLRSRVGITYSF
ncbi:oligogalacturonate-specific porin KdgM family protein [Vibrio agarivorans]|uniref:Oligogalacturonate-specific porin KdgM family protein n=1 Tax=Vibrio agarivorans TaxID=153622 RepID=A0ABT7Y6E6_9VIBR|nr:oligogalacturonate-specific porin KdgM family protein [Vibrio agarivorans]MDN2483623.1 oligogalacturonate-specific porin KdgM family protein [Vibrio agarivorans]MDN3660601.1 oligogalacturonate-specific porin KdgM family protein [Vibrio agarivorans]